MVTPASLPRILGPLTCLTLLCSSLPVSAQEAKNAAGAKEQSEEAVFIPVEYRPPPYQVSVGVRLAGKAKVRFSGIGNIPYNGANPQANATDTTLTRVYDNGYVGPDDSVNIAGEPIDRGDGQTNAWSFTSTDQYDNSTFSNARSIALQANSIEGNGATAAAESSTSTAWDIEISRQLGGNKRISWGIIFGAGISDINAKTKGTVKANLRTITDVYAVDGTDQRLSVLGADGTTRVYRNGYTAPGPELWAQKLKADGTLEFDADGKPVLALSNGFNQYPTGLNPVFEWRDDSVRLGALPTTRSDVVTEGVDVAGTWQVKGAFMTARFGPYVALQLGRRFAVRASAGLTLTVLGAQFRFREESLVPSISKYLAADTENLDRNESTVTGTIGYFASGEFDWFMTNRTGLFIGAMYEDYTRNLRITMPGTTQVADIEASTGAVFRTGITTRF